MKPLVSINKCKFAECEKCRKLMERGTFDIYYVCDIKQDWCEECVKDLHCCDECGTSCKDDTSFTNILGNRVCPLCVDQYWKGYVSEKTVCA